MDENLTLHHLRCKPVDSKSMPARHRHVRSLSVCTSFRRSCAASNRPAPPVPDAGNTRPIAPCSLPRSPRARKRRLQSLILNAPRLAVITAVDSAASGSGTAEPERPASVPQCNLAGRAPLFLRWALVLKLYVAPIWRSANPIAPSADAPRPRLAVCNRVVESISFWSSVISTCRDKASPQWDKEKHSGWKEAPRDHDRFRVEDVACGGETASDDLGRIVKRAPTSFVALPGAGYQISDCEMLSVDGAHGRQQRQSDGWTS